MVRVMASSADDEKTLGVVEFMPEVLCFESGTGTWGKCHPVQAVRDFQALL